LFILQYSSEFLRGTGGNQTGVSGGFFSLFFTAEGGITVTESRISASESRLYAAKSRLYAAESGLPAVESRLYTAKSRLYAAESGVHTTEICWNNNNVLHIFLKFYRINIFGNIFKKSIYNINKLWLICNINHFNIYINMFLYKSIGFIGKQ
jgi:hypothetical protein